MEDFKDSKTALVGDADCTADGKALCDKIGVRGYPTIKYGDPNNLEEYTGGPVRCICEYAPLLLILIDFIYFNWF